MAAVCLALLLFLLVSPGWRASPSLVPGILGCSCSFQGLQAAVPAHGRASAGPLMRGSGQLMRGSALMRGSGRAADARFGSKRSFPTGRHLGCGCEGFNRLWPTRGPGGRIYQVQRYEALVHAGSPTAGENRRRREPVIQSLYPENELCRQLHVAARVGMASRAMAQI